MDFLLSYARNWFSGLCNYGLRVGDALSQLVNVVVFFGDNPNESVSGRAHRENHKWFWRAAEIAINAVFRVFGPDHCQKAHEKDMSSAAKFLRNGK